MVNNINITSKQSGDQFTADEFNLLLNGVNSAITEFNTNLSVEKIEVFTATEKNKLSTIEDGAEVNVNADWDSTSGDSQILNKPALGTAASINYWTGTQIEYDANTVKNGVAAQTADLATIIG